jgi:hypothetical protein
MPFTTTTYTISDLIITALVKRKQSILPLPWYTSPITPAFDVGTQESLT